jgi:hypothetical protein
LPSELYAQPYSSLHHLITSCADAPLRTISEILEFRAPPLGDFLGNFVANVPATDGPGNGGQYFSVTRANLVAQHPTNQGTKANSHSTVLGRWFGSANWLRRCRLGKCGGIVRNLSARLRSAGVLCLRYSMQHFRR